MTTCARFLVSIGLAIGTVETPAVAAESVLSVCTAIDEANGLDGKIVTVTGLLSGGMEGFGLSAVDCTLGKERLAQRWPARTWLSLINNRDRESVPFQWPKRVTDDLVATVIGRVGAASDLSSPHRGKGHTNFYALELTEWRIVSTKISSQSFETACAVLMALSDRRDQVVRVRGELILSGTGAFLRPLGCELPNASTLGQWPRAIWVELDPYKADIRTEQPRERRAPYDYWPDNIVVATVVGKLAVSTDFTEGRAPALGGGSAAEGSRFPARFLSAGLWHLEWTTRKQADSRR